MDDIMVKVSRTVIIASVCILIIAVFTHFQTKVRNMREQSVVSQLSSTAAPSVSPAVTGSATQIKLSLEGPIACSHTTKEASYSAVIKSKKILVRQGKGTVTQNYLVSGDCLYTWNAGSTTGKKTCGIGQYVGMADSLSSMGLLNMSTILSLVSQYSGTAGLGSIPAQDIFEKSCKTGVINDTAFTIPSEVRFVAEDISNLQKKP
jgi:hypothetical protein